MEPNSEVIPWYASKIIWAQIVAALFGLLTFVRPGLVESLGVTQEQVLTTIIVVVSIFTGIKRWGPTPDVVGTQAKATEIMEFRSQTPEPSSPIAHDKIEAVAEERPTTADSGFSGNTLLSEARKRESNKRR